MIALAQGYGRLYHDLLDLLFPPRCVGCDRLGVWLCERCAQCLPFLDGPVCVQCGRPLTEIGVCPICRKKSLRLDSIRSTFLFEGVVRDAVYALKYRGAYSVTAPLVGRMADYWRRHHLKGDILVPVPLHPKRERKRGYNQSILLAQELGHQLGLPVTSQLLCRVRNTVSQTKLNQQERRVNVQDAFALTKSVKLTGTRLVLIDDIATTGATLDACAKVLLEAGAEAVCAFTLARAA